MPNDTELSRPVITTKTSFEILSKIREESGTTLENLDNQMELSRSTIHRHLATLESIGYLNKDGQIYDISLKFLDLGTYARENVELYSVGAKSAQRLAQKTEETVWLVSEEDGQAVHLYKAIGENPFQVFANVGSRRSLHQLAAGKAILSQFSDEKVENIIEKRGLPERTPNTITDRDRLFKELAQIRERGYALNNEEAINGLNAVGAAITVDEEVYGGISVAGPANRLKGDRLEQDIADKLLSVINEIEIQIRHT